jgi:hypothetical protein
MDLEPQVTPGHDVGGKRPRHTVPRVLPEAGEQTKAPAPYRQATSGRLPAGESQRAIERGSGSRTAPRVLRV